VSRAVVFGGYGTFGGRVGRELARFGVGVTIAGRDGNRAAAFAGTLGNDCRGVAADVSRPADCRAALTGAAVAVHCAGPFRAADTALLDACLDAGCHYVDIADDRAYAAKVREYGDRFAARGLTAAYGCSSLPGISGALALRAAAGRPDRPERARVTLFIGNDNPKGAAAVASLVGGLGRPIAAPQGELRGFRDREIVPLPPPFGPRPVFNFDSPDYDLLPALVGVRSVSVKVGFELRPATYAFAALARLPFRYGRRTACVLDLPGRLVRGVGSSGGAVMAELLFAAGTERRAALVARQDGQRVAALPAAYAAQALATARPLPRGAVTASDLLGAEELLARLVGDGFELHDRTEP
jgi:short subunit dehydrogenase-like uncharacterized protein